MRNADFFNTAAKVETENIEKRLTQAQKNVISGMHAVAQQFNHECLISPFLSNDDVVCIEVRPKEFQNGMLIHIFTITPDGDFLIEEDK